jgi:hypothetical protein
VGISKAPFSDAHLVSVADSHDTLPREKMPSKASILQAPLGEGIPVWAKSEVLPDELFVGAIFAQMARGSFVS